MIYHTTEVRFSVHNERATGTWVLKLKVCIDKNCEKSQEDRNARLKIKGNHGGWTT